MKPPLPENDGSRPSGLEIARRLTGELPRLGDPAELALQAELDAVGRALPPFDWEPIRAASVRAAELDRRRPPTRRRHRGLFRALVPLAVVATALVVAIPRHHQASRTKGAADLDFFLMRDERVYPGMDDMPLRAGDRVQFTYRADGLDSLVLLSIDGEGKLTVFYPGSGDSPVPVIPGGRHVLAGSIVLDDAPGPELFVAVFGPGSVQEARELVLRAWRQGGAEAVLALAGTDPALDVVAVEKAP